MDQFAEFLRERQYLLNVSPATLTYYRCAFKAWKKHSDDGDPKTWVINMRKAGISPVSCNTYICALNAYWKWAGEGKHLVYLKEEQKILATFSADQVKRFINFRPKGTNQTRAHVVCCLILDTGLRISEVLGLRHQDADLDNLVLRVTGKGNKQRLVPFTFGLRRLLWHYLKGRAPSPVSYLFPTRNGTRTTVRNFQRDFRLFCDAMKVTNVRASPHTLRHTFAAGYLRNGGNVYYLSKILGHTNVSTTERYLQSLGIEDLKAVHERFSLLAVRS